MPLSQGFSTFGAAPTPIGCCIVAIGFGWSMANNSGVKLCMYEQGQFHLLDEIAVNARIGALCFARKEGMLYTAEEHSSDGRLQGSGTIRAFQVSDGRLDELDTFPSGDSYPCALAIGVQETVLAVGHHGLNSSFGLFKTTQPGHLVFHHLEGGMPTGKWQLLESRNSSAPVSYYHSVAFLDDKTVIASNTGTGRLEVYRLASRGDTLIESETAFNTEGKSPRTIRVVQEGRAALFNYEFNSGFGLLSSQSRLPCHFDFPDSQCYSYEELSPFEGCRFEAKKSFFATSPGNHSTEHSYSSFAVYPSSRFAYTINRSKSCIDCVKFNIDFSRYVKYASFHIDGGRARDIAISPDGRYAFLADTELGRILRFDIDDDGMLCNQLCVLTVPEPTTIIMIPCAH